MPNSNRIHVSEVIAVNKTSASKEFTFFLQLPFLDKRVKVSNTVFNSCHDVLMMYTDVNNIAIFNTIMVMIIVGIRYLITITINTFRIRKNEVLYVFKNFDLTQKKWIYKWFKTIIIFFFFIIKMSSENTYHKKNKIKVKTVCTN